MKKIEMFGNKVALVSDEDFDHLSKFKWAINKSKTSNTSYACTYINERRVSMHRLIMNVTDKKIFIDHKDGNGLNNQRENLRIVTHGQNMANRRSHKNSTSKYLGVYWRTRKKRWVATIRKDGIRKHLGSFVSETDAALAYNKAAIELHGEFANPNIIS